MACLDFAVSNEMEYGTFGGYTAAERAEFAERAEQHTQPRAKAKRGRAPISANELNRRATAYEQGCPDAEIAELVDLSIGRRPVKLWTRWCGWVLRVTDCDRYGSTGTATCRPNWNELGLATGNRRSLRHEYPTTGLRARAHSIGRGRVPRLVR